VLSLPGSAPGSRRLACPVDGGLALYTNTNDGRASIRQPTYAGGRTSTCSSVRSELPRSELQGFISGRFVLAAAASNPSLASRPLSKRWVCMLSDEAMS
jgi:hypothetical protein